MVFKFDKLAANPALLRSALVFLGCRITPTHHFLGLGAFDQTLAHGPSFAPLLLMVIVTLLTLEHSSTIVTGHPGQFRTNGSSPTTFARVRAKMILHITVRFLALVTVVCAGKETRHFRNHVVVIVVHVQINLFVFLRTTVDDVVVVLFGHDVDLILGQIRLKPLSFLDTTRSQRNAGVGVQFLCQLRLQWPIGHPYMTVTTIVINFGFSHHKRTSHA